MNRNILISYIENTVYHPTITKIMTVRNFETISNKCNLDKMCKEIFAVAKFCPAKENNNSIQFLFICVLTQQPKQGPITDWARVTETNTHKTRHFVTSEYLTNSMEMSSSWEAASCEATQEIPKISWNLKVDYRVYKSPPLVPILIQINPLHTTILISLRSILIFSTRLRLGLPSGLLYFCLSHQCPICIPLPPFVLHALSISSSLTWSF
jgi:hypothetical protein